VVKTDTSAISGCGGDALKDPPYSQLILCNDGGSSRDSRFSVSLSSTKLALHQREFELSYLDHSAMYP
jgi:hypothetical protein